jgi:hypothetical protein
VGRAAGGVRGDSREAVPVIDACQV